jgi:hypothetical protein
MLRSVGHARIPDLADLADTIALLVLGGAVDRSPVHTGAVVLAVLVSALLVVLTRPRARPMVLALVVLPLAGMWLASQIKPLWHLRTVAFTGPFVTLTLAVGRAAGVRATAAAPVQRLLASAAAVAVLAAFAYLATLEARAPERPQDYRAAAAIVQARAVSGDAILTSSMMDLWAMLRYLDGPRWGSPVDLAVPDPDGRWTRILVALDRTPAQPIVARLRGAAPTIERHGFSYGMAAAGSQAPRQPGTIWLVLPTALEEVSGIAGPAERVRGEWRVHGLRVLALEGVEVP